jgi:predicted MPP superfamily phosphohydrolase
VIFWIAALSFIVVSILGMKGVSGLFFDSVFFMMGSCWIAVMLYGFLILLAIDISRIIGWAGNIRPDFIYLNYPLTKSIMFGAICFVLTIILSVGYNNANRLRVTPVKIALDKKAGTLSGLRVVMASDIHLGHINGRKSLARIVDVMNEQCPDIVLLAGDIFDSSPEPVIREDMGVELERLQTKYGAYVVSGNHEYIGERGRHHAKNFALNYLSSHGIKPLLDSVVLIDNSFYVAGRNDRSVGARKTIPELLHSIDRKLPVIMLDHQPYRLDEAEHAGIDLHLSGHTHHGQLWPLNYITAKLFEHDWGYLQKGKTNFYISCGIGTWGPPIRTAGYSEVVIIDLKFNR